MVKDNSSKIEKRKERNERVKITFFYPFKNNWVTTSISLCLFILFFIWNTIHTNPFNILIYLSAVVFFLPYTSDFSFYISYYDARYSIVRLLRSSKNGRESSDLNLEKFQIDYNNLRKSLKKHIRSSRGNLLTYDYELRRIVHDVDTFFDATIKILFRRKLMSIPFSPHDAYQKFIEDELIQSRLADDRWQDIEPPPSEYEFEAWEIKDINLSSINTFLEYFGEVLIKKPPGSKALNTVAIGELFRSWNLIVEKLNKPIFVESKKDVEKYYDERRERRGFLLDKLFWFSVYMIPGVISIAIAYFRL